jgi:hypothetical protein
MFGIEKDFQNLMEQVYGPLNKNKMTEKIDPSHIIKDGDSIYFFGEKYQKVETPQSFYDKLWGLLKTKLGDTSDCDEMADRVRDLIRENIPEPKKGPGLSEYSIGFNEAIRQVNLRLFNGIQ